MSALFIILVALKLTSISEKMLISTRCICSVMPNLNKKKLNCISSYYALLPGKDGVSNWQVCKRESKILLWLSSLFPLQLTLDLRKILVTHKIFLKSRFYLISNTRNNHKKLLIKHKIANWAPQTIKMPISNGFDYLCRHFHSLNRKIWKFYLKK